MASESTDPALSPNTFGRYHFLLRRLHSLSGIVPVGAFVIFHLFTNHQLIYKPLGFEDAFQHEVEWIHSALPALLFLEIFGIWLPIAFHAGLGLVYTFTGKSNVKNYSYWDNWRYTLQRVTGILALIFIVFHIATLRWRWDIAGIVYTPFFVDGIVPAGHGGVAASSGGYELIALSSYSTAVALQIWWVAVLYVIGVLSVVFHWSNGLWTAAISWGVTLSAKAQKNWAYACYAMFAFLFACSAAALAGAWMYQPDDREVRAYQMALALHRETGMLPHEVFEHGHDGGEVKPQYRQMLDDLAERTEPQTAAVVFPPAGRPPTPAAAVTTPPGH